MKATDIYIKRFKTNRTLAKRPLETIEEKDDYLRSVKVIIQENIDKKISRDSKESTSANRLRNNQKL